MFPAVLPELSHPARPVIVRNERTTSDDVTQQFVDLKARLLNLQDQEARLRDILGMAKTVEEVLDVEQELERVRGDLESLQGQMNFIEANVEMSSISVRIVEPTPSFVPPGANWGEVLQTAIAGLFLTIRGLIILGFSLMPLLAVGGPAFYLYKRRTRRTRLNGNAPTTAR